MMKKGIHPEWYPEAKVICNGNEVMTVGGTKQVYNVDVYSGNHPFYQGVRTVLIADDGQLNKWVELQR
jgi:ribosomal protein L31